jgi:Domain of unknown function (DUF3576)
LSLSRIISSTMLTVVMSGCTAIQNDLNKGLAYGSNSDRITRKSDEGQKYAHKQGAVNAYLWRAAMETLGYMPLLISDAREGVIVTDWYSAPADSGIRNKLTVEVLNDDLRRDTLRVVVLRELRQGDTWVSAPPPSQVASSLEEVIYTKAHDLRQW